MRSRILGTAVLMLAAAAPLSARPRHRPPPPYGGYVDRYGFLIGFSVGAGVVAPDPCEGCGVLAGAEVHLGAMATPEVAFMLEAGGLGRDDLHHVFLAAAAQWWPDPYERFWLRGGLGIGSEGSDTEEHHDSAYPTVLAAAGVEVVRRERFTTELLVQAAATHTPHRWGRSVSVNVGFNWY